jgi:hypothetical protein
MWNSVRIGLHIGPLGVRSYDLRLRRALATTPDLAKALEPLRGSGACLEVVLSDAHCRYLVMTRPEGIRNREELAAAVRSRFQLSFGELEGWQLRHEASPFHTQDFVAAIDQTRLQELEVEARTAGLKLVSVRPQWVAWARHFRRHTRRGAHWIVVPEGGWLSLGYIVDGRCQQARALRVGAHATSLADLLARERALVEGADPNATVYVVGDGLALDGASVMRRPSGALWDINA